MTPRPFVRFFTITLLLVAGVNHAIAQENPMKLTMMVEEEIEVTDAQGNRSVKRVAAESIIPGDIVVYTTHYRYQGEQAAENVVINNIIPPEVTYLPGSASGSDTITFSVDGGKHFDTPDNLTVIDSEGNPRPATAKDYSHIRWLLPSVASGATGNVSFKTKVNEE